MSARVLLKLLNELRKRDEMRGFFRISFINSIIHGHGCYMTLILLKITFLALETPKFCHHIHYNAAL